MVVINYVEGLTESLSRVYRKHGIKCAMKPHSTLRKLLVHPKDRIEKPQTCGVVYSIPCKNCNKVYIGETGRQLGTRCKEHRDDVEGNTTGILTRSMRKSSSSDWHKSAITDHAMEANHVIDWEGVQILEKETHNVKRGVLEAIHMKATKGQTMNRDEGRHCLSNVYNPLLAKLPGVANRT